MEVDVRLEAAQPERQVRRDEMHLVAAMRELEAQFARHHAGAAEVRVARDADLELAARTLLRRRGLALRLRERRRAARRRASAFALRRFAFFLRLRQPPWRSLLSGRARASDRTSGPRTVALAVGGSRERAPRAGARFDLGEEARGQTVAAPRRIELARVATQRRGALLPPRSRPRRAARRASPR